MEETGFILSPQQKRIWAYGHANPVPLTRSMRVRLEGPMQVQGLVAAVSVVTARHEILRTRFPAWPDGYPVQEILDPGHAELPTPVCLVPKGSITTAHQDAIAPDCSSRPPWSVIVKPCPIGTHGVELKVTGHALTLDWAGLGLLVQEIMDAYAGRPAPEEEAFQYADYAAWQEECRLQAAGAVPGETAPGGDEPGFRRRESGTGTARWEFTGLEALFQGTPPSPWDSCFLAAWGVVTARLAGNEEIRTGVVLDGRTQPALDRMLGPTEKMFPWTQRLDGAFASLAAAYEERQLDAASQFDQWFGNDGLQEGWARFQWVEVPELVPPSGVRAEVVELLDASPPAGLCLTCWHQGGSVAMQVQVDGSFVDLAPAAFASFLGEQVRHVVTLGVQDPKRLVASLPLAVSDPGRAPWSLDLSAPLPAPAVPGVTDRIRHWAESTPDASAVSFSGQTWTYRRLWQATQQVASELIRLGHEPGDAVVVMPERSFGMVAAIVGILHAGGVLVLVDPDLPATRRELLIRESGARFLISVGIQESTDPGGIPFRAVLQVQPSGDGLFDSAAPLEEVKQPRPQDPAYVFFTSGTTGVPQAVRGTHLGLGHFIDWQGREFGITAADRVAQLTGLSFDVVLRDLFLPLCHGARLCLPPPDSVGVAGRILGWMNEEMVTTAHLVPSIAHWWLGQPGPLPRLRSLKRVFFAGEPLIAPLVTRWRELTGFAGEVVNLYGPTETTLAKCYYRVPNPPLPGMQPVGRPLPDTQVLVQRASGTRCAAGEPGEIVIRTPCRTRGRMEDGSTLASRFQQNPDRPEDPEDLLYRTGDLGRLYQDGCLEILGRMDDQVKIHGVRISPGEIQAVLGGHPGVEHAVVLAERGPDGSDPPRLVAFAATSPDDCVLEPELLEHLRRRLPQVMVPERVHLLPEIPLTPNGKADRARLLEAARSAPARRPGADPVAPSGAREEGILEMWRQLFKRTDLGVEDNFFELGGHSLLATQLTARIREKFSCLAPLNLAFEAPTVREYAQRLDEVRRIAGSPVHTAPPMLPSSADGRVLPLSTSQMRLWLLYKLEPPSGAYNIPINLRLQGELNPECLKGALGDLVQRHASLRTEFFEHDGRPSQRVRTGWMPLIEEVDLATLGSRLREDELQELADREARQTFLLEDGPPVRAVLVRTLPTEHFLLLTLHHIIGDGWSSVILARDLAGLYGARSEGSDPGLTPPAMSYADHVLWEQSRQADGGHPGLDHWRRRLEGVSLNPTFPTDHPRSPWPTHLGSGITFRLDPVLTKRLQALAREEKATTFMTLLPAFQLFLMRSAGLEEVCVGTPVANRTRMETEGVAGCFINTMVMPARLPGRISFREHLRNARRQIVEDFQHQDCPFEEVVRMVRPERRLNATPLFQVLFNVLEFDTPPADTRGSSLTFERVWLGVPDSKYDLTLYVRAGSELELQFVYNAALFDPDRMALRATEFHRFLEQIAAAPDRCLHDHELTRMTSASLLEASPKRAKNQPAEEPLSTAPQTDMERRLTPIWHRTLGGTRAPGIHDDFFDLGGHSLLAMQMVHEIGQSLGRRVPLRWLFENPTVSQLARHLEHLVWNFELESLTHTREEVEL